MTIKLRFTSCEGSRWTKTFKSVAGARKAIIDQIGQPEIGSTYAMSGDGVCKVEVSGDATLRDLFPVVAETSMPVLAAEQGRVATLDGARAGVDFISYEQVPLGRLDLVFSNGRWIDKRTTDGEILAVDGRNAI